MSLSIKQAEDKFENNNKRSNDKKENDNVRSSKNNKLNFEDILSKYLKDSEERMQDFRKNQDSKQRGYGKRNFG